MNPTSPASDLDEPNEEGPDRDDVEGVEQVEEFGVDAAVIQHPYDPSKTQISTTQTTLDVLIKRLRHGEIDLQPDFQRAVVWREDRMSRMIESLLIRIPLPAFYFDGTNDELWEVVDGLQRLSALYRFVVADGTLERPGVPLTLSGLEYLKELNGLSFSAIPRSMQRRIEEAPVVLHVIRPGTPMEVKYNIFRRINTGGMVLTAQEIRHALNKGPALDFLRDLARDPAFLKATANSVSARRMLDREMVLRFCAFSLTPFKDYREGNLDRFLTRAMGELNKLEQAARDELGDRFRQAMRVAAAIFARDAFRKRRSVDAKRQPVNLALFEPWSVLLGQVTAAHAARLVERREEVIALHIAAMNDPAFFIAISQGTGDVAKVRLRFETIQSIIRQVTEGVDG